MQVLVNGESKQFEDGISLAELINVLDLPGQRIAIELNHEVARRADWENTRLKDKDRVEIVHFVGGGAESNLQDCFSEDARSRK
ncbi:MAG TPA: sulfur carrier protein ThiS [Pyrinomonadaceae bacterium]|nr:sulfur carrier protein ThiS [Pyrinomonadaceae bacterium]